MSSSTYSRFFTPQTISLLFCLHQIAKQANQINPKDQLVSFLVQKILKITQAASQINSNQVFEAQLLSVISDVNFLHKYRQIINQINSFNQFYRELSNILKTLRTLRSSKLEQGNLVDFLIRRMYVYFEKLDFKEIVTIYQNFIAYREGRLSESQSHIKQHQFMLTKSIEQVKFNLQNYTIPNPQELNKLIDSLQQSDHTFKTSYLKGMLKAQQKTPISSADSIHRYFDKSLGNLFQQKIEAQTPSNKINHCILSLAYVSLQMGQLDQCLQSISQGLRISQNNSDQESINNCIIYLYKIAQQLGKFRQQILLAEHAITHSLNLSNLILMLYSCLSYSYLEKSYDCQDPSLMILKSRHISWTQALHFAKKKIYSSFENNCKNIYHTHRNLLIPSFLHKIAILLHLPQLTPILLNPYYERQELLELQVYQQYTKNNQLNKLLKKARKEFNLGQFKLFWGSEIEIDKFRQNCHNPLQIIEIDSFKNQIKVQQNLSMESYQNIQKLLKFCTKNGYFKQEYIIQLNLMNRILLDRQLYYDALVKIQQALRLAKHYKSNQQLLYSQLLKAEAEILLDNLEEPLEIIRQIEQSGKIYDNNIILQKQFYKVKRLINKKLVKVIDRQECPQQWQIIIRNELDCIEKQLDLNMSQLYLEKIKGSLQQLLEFIKWHPTYLPKFQKAKKTYQYVNKVITIFSQFNEQTSNDEEILTKLRIKISKMYFQD